MDPRYTQLAELLVNYSTALRSGENILIETFDIPAEMTIALVRAARKAGGNPHVAERSQRILAALYEASSDEGFRTWAEYDLARMERMQAYIGLRGSHNVNELSGVPDAQMQKQARLYAKPVHFERRVNHTRWCVLRWPTPSMAQLANMSTEAFEEFYFRVCCLDWSKMERAAKALADRMSRTDMVHLRGPGDTDLTFSIKGIGVVPCTGHMNIPDGEVFTSPVKESVNGIIHFNTPTLYNGVSFENIRLEFRDGRIVKAWSAQNDDRLQQVLDTDAGARYVGEFAIGFHPHILAPMKDILFDEKIAGSIHFTPGRAYESADNGNRSEIHWDLVLIQRPEYGGGTLAFDGEVVRRDGEFLTPDLVALNRDRLA
ncbi:MAG TPA: aminopeptidase [Phycisphaerales bacterium]|nr:aminopeptidase [Phycisphaerales bacterium]HMP35814.1 aminopeptidase [Phycisphaerales bacterium]